jgi:hypothetical protein
MLQRVPPASLRAAVFRRWHVIMTALSALALGVFL